MPIDASESDAAAAVQVQASDDVAAEQEPCKRCNVDSSKSGRHTCSKRRADANTDAAQKRTRSTRLSAGTPVEPNGSDESSLSLTSPTRL